MGEPAGSGHEATSAVPPAEASEPERGRRVRLLLLVAAVALALDIGTKILVVATLSDREPLRLLGGALYLTEARNTGAAFSMAQGATVVFTLVAVVVVGIILRASARIRSVGWAVALGLVLGGAAGNLTDRMFRSPGPFRGAVVDFLSVFDPYGRVWPIFNLADSAVFCGAALAAVLALRGIDLDGSGGERRPRATA